MSFQRVALFLRGRQDGSVVWCAIEGPSIGFSAWLNARTSRSFWLSDEMEYKQGDEREQYALDVEGSGQARAPFLKISRDAESGSSL